MKFNVIYYNLNSRKMEEYNILPYLDKCYKEAENKPKTFDEFKEFVKSNSKYMWWSRCQYEIILSDWPNNEIEEKWDIHRQIMMNIDFITRIFAEYELNQTFLQNN